MQMQAGAAPVMIPMAQFPVAGASVNMVPVSMQGEDRPGSAGTVGQRRKLTEEEKKLARGGCLKTFPIATIVSVVLCFGGGFLLLGGFLATWEGMQLALEFGGKDPEDGIFVTITESIEPATIAMVSCMCVPAILSLIVGLFTWKKINEPTERERSYEELNNCGDLLKCLGCLSTTSQFYRISFFAAILNIILWFVSILMVIMIGNLTAITYGLLKAVTEVNKRDLISELGTTLVTMKATARNMTDENLGLALNAMSTVNTTIDFMISSTSELMGGISDSLEGAESGVGESLGTMVDTTSTFADASLAAFDSMIDIMTINPMADSDLCTGNPNAIPDDVNCEPTLDTPNDVEEQRADVAESGNDMKAGMSDAVTSINDMLGSLGAISDTVEGANNETANAIGGIGSIVGELGVALVQFEQLLYGEGGPFEEDLSGFLCPDPELIPIGLTASDMKCMNLNEYRFLIPQFAETCLCNEDVANLLDALTTLTDGLILSEVGSVGMMLGLVFLLAANSSNYTYLGRRRFIEQGGQFKDMVVFDSTFSPDKGGMFDEKSKKKNQVKRAESEKGQTLQIP